MNTQDKIQIMQAFVEGKTIEAKHKTIPGDQYLPLAREKEPLWNWEAFDYRIKPEPMVIQVWTHPNEKMFIRFPKQDYDYLTTKGYTLKTFVEKGDTLPVRS